jgi:hypothetical protein
MFKVREASLTFERAFDGASGAADINSHRALFRSFLPWRAFSNSASATSLNPNKPAHPAFDFRRVKLTKDDSLRAPTRPATCPGMKIPRLHVRCKREDGRGKRRHRP